MGDVLAFETPMTEADAARRLGVSIDTVRRERKRRRIRYVMIGGRPRYTPAHLVEYLAAQEVAPCRDSSDRDSSPATGSAVEVCT
ncbi:helix-turn-helix domain-containing protein [Falsiroseomonas sp.]|uniref:helix-turn-helix domain-containing protein n=1 Tax=Falsiroseomonas sp. TaxID=2870721 RepID=UPI0034A4B68D